MRKQTTRRGLRRRVRKNKTMKGGWGSIKASTFLKEGYLYAVDALEQTKKPEYKFMPSDITGNTKKANAIKIAYSTYFNSLNTSDRQIDKWVPSASSPGGARLPLNMLSGDNKTNLLEPANFNKTIDDIASGKAAKFSGFIFVSTNQTYVDFGRSFKKFTGEDIMGSLTSVGSAAANFFSKGVSAAPDKLNAMKAMANSPQAAAAKAVALHGAQNVIGSVTSGKYSGAASEVAGSLLRNVPGPLGAVARFAPSIAGTVANKAAGTAAGFAAKNPAEAIAMAKKFGVLGSKWPL